MNTEQITITVDAEAAKTYRTASPDERRRLDVLLSLRLHDLNEPSESLDEIMDRIASKAAARGLTPEILEQLLKDD